MCVNLAAQPHVSKAASVEPQRPVPMDSALATTLRQGFASPWALTHARPWAECASDAERLDVFNGFLLSANLDALFDDFLISFTDEGGLLMAAHVGSSERENSGWTIRCGYVGSPNGTFHTCVFTVNDFSNQMLEMGLD